MGVLANMAAGSHLNDRIEAGATGMSVRTVALDDLAAAGDFRPGVHQDGHRGRRVGMRCAACPGCWLEVRPVLVLEQSPDDMRVTTLLTAADYLAVDLSTYRPIGGRGGFRPRRGRGQCIRRCRGSGLPDNRDFSAPVPKLAASLLAK